MAGAIALAQQTIEQVEDDDRPRIADVGKVVDGGPADIHAHLSLIHIFLRREVADG